jgi:hypothetical protein
MGVTGFQASLLSFYRKMLKGFHRDVVADLQQYFDDDFGLEVGVLENFGNIRGMQITQGVDVAVNCAFGRLFAYNLGTKGSGHCASFTSLGPYNGPRREGAKARVSASRLVVKGSSRLETG